MKVKVLLVLVMALSQIAPLSGQKKERSSKKITISGTVVNKEKRPVENAIIFLDTLFTRSVTDEQGNYRVKADPSVKTITAVLPNKGFGQADLSASGPVDITVLDNPVTIPAFAIRGIKANQKLVEKHEKMNTYPNIYEMIRGECTGVTVSGSSIQIRQGHSFFGSSTPIFVVNGVKVPSIDNIVPTQVKKIELLTGSAAAMYVGVEGAPGVIRITLKSGGD